MANGIAHARAECCDFAHAGHAVGVLADVVASLHPK